MQDARTRLEAILRERIAVLDGSWGVLIQRQLRGEEAYRGERFKDHPRDVAGDPDLLNLTRPEVVLGIHRDYFAAGADIATTNTFTATTIGQADYALEAHAYEMNLAGAQLARRAADEVGGFVAGSVGPLNVTLSLSPRVDEPAYRTHTFDADPGRLRGAGPRARRRWRRLPPDRDDLRHAEREGGDRRSTRRGAGPAALDLLHRDRPQRPQSVRPDSRRVLALGRARAAVHRRRQLLARRDADEAVRRRPRTRRPDLGRVPSERRPAERDGHARRAARRHEQVPARVRPGRAGERRRRLLRHDSRARQGDHGRSPGSDPETRPGPGARDAAQRARAVPHLPGRQLRHGRRANERHRLGPVPAADRGRRLPGGRRGRAGAGPWRRQHPRREHGRRPAGCGGGDHDLSQPGGHRAGCRAHPDHGRQLQVERAPGRAQVPAGEGRRQLDQPEGGRGALPRPGARDQALRRRGDRDGLRRKGSGRHRGAQGRHLRARLQAPDG